MLGCRHTGSANARRALDWRTEPGPTILLLPSVALAQALELPSRPADQVGVDTQQRWSQPAPRGLLALASLNHACRDLVPAFLQRSQPLLLAIAACSGLRPAPDCRHRRALLHLSYSCAPPILTTALVTHGTLSPSRHAARGCLLMRVDRPWRWGEG